MDTILIEALEFYAFHGVPDAEQEVGHRYCVDLRLQVDTHLAGHSDRVEDTVNYAQVADCAIQVGVRERFRLIEALAERIASVVLERFPPVQSVTVRVRKPLPPMNAIAGAVGVEILRGRESAVRQQ